MGKAETIVQQNREISRLTALVKRLQQEVKNLREQGIHQKQQQNDAPQTERENHVSKPKDYTTDEEELQEEVHLERDSDGEFHQQTKKRKLSPQKDINIKKTQKYTDKYTADAKPPPIIIEKVKDFKKLQDIINKTATAEYVTKVIAEEKAKIFLKSNDDYQKLVAALDSLKDIEWFTYENKKDRHIRVVIKNLHHSWTEDEVKTNLGEQGFVTHSVTKKLQYKTKKPLDMFFVSFDKATDIKKIYDIKYILHTPVSIEPVKKSNLVPQCTRCQEFGHTQNFCHKSPRCVKCGENHETTACTAAHTCNPKCANCGEKHPANYRGCEAAKAAQLRITKQGQKDTQPNRSSQQPSRQDNSKSSQAAIAPRTLPSATETTGPASRASFSAALTAGRQADRPKDIQDLIRVIIKQNSTLIDLLTK